MFRMDEGSKGGTTPSVSYHQSYRKCGKSNCTTCKEGQGHGPYWYARWREGSRTRSRYLGRTGPDVRSRRRIEVRCLGTFQVLRVGGETVRWTQRPRDLFTMLLSAPAGTVPRDEIVESLWPNADPVAGQHSLRATVAAARGLLGEAHWLVFDGPSVTLALPAGSRDDVIFEQAAQRALAADDFELMRQAVGLYGGMYLPEDRYNDWTVYRRYQLTELRRELVHRAVEVAIESGSPRDALTWIRPVVLDDLCDESSARLLMTLYLQLDRRVDAIRLYWDVGAALKKDLDVAPDSQTTALYASAKAGAIHRGG